MITAYGLTVCVAVHLLLVCVAQRVAFKFLKVVCAHGGTPCMCADFGCECAAEVLCVVVS